MKKEIQRQIQASWLIYPHLVEQRIWTRDGGRNFSGLLSGSAFGPHIPKMFVDYKKMLDIGHFIMVIDPERFIAVEGFLKNMDRMIHEIHSLTPAKGFAKVLVPGEIEALQEEKRRLEGIPLQILFVPI